MRLAVVGAYGSGKTTFSRALAQLTGYPRTHAGPMVRAAGTSTRTVRDCTPPELVQLIVQRYVERLIEEARHRHDLISDGSAIHEWVYGKVRVVAGSYPGNGMSLSQWERDPATQVIETIVDQIGLMMKQYADKAYDAFLFLPIEFPLAETNPPISEQFRVISDQVMLNALDQFDVPKYVLRGSLSGRLRQAFGALGLTPVAGISEVGRPDRPEPAHPTPIWTGCPS